MKSLNLSLLLTISAIFFLFTSLNSQNTKNMRTIKQQVTIDAPIDNVWSVISKIGDLKNQNPGNSESYLTSDKTSGVGTCRRVEKKNGKIKLDHKVIDWQDGKKISMESTKIVGIPVSQDIATIQLEDVGEKTKLTMIYSYRMKGIARLLPTKGAFMDGIRSSVLSFKYHIEETVPVTEDMYKSTIVPLYKNVDTSVD